jgi:hypothetical protein
VTGTAAARLPDGRRQASLPKRQHRWRDMEFIIIHDRRKQCL